MQLPLDSRTVISTLSARNLRPPVQSACICCRYIVDNKCVSSAVPHSPLSGSAHGGSTMADPAHDDIHEINSVYMPNTFEHDDKTAVQTLQEGYEAEAQAAVRKADVIFLTDQTNLLPLKKVVSVFCGLSLCLLVSTLDSTMVATALPTISNAFNAGSIVSWVPSGYLLTSTAFQPLCTYKAVCAAALRVYIADAPM